MADNFQKLLMRLFMNTKFEVPVIPIQIDDKNFLSYISQGIETTNRIFITDFDGIYEKKGTNPLYRIFFNYLADENKAINLYEIDKCIKRITAGESAREVFKEITAYLKSPKVDLRKSQYDDACKKAAEEWEQNEEAFGTIAKLRERAYRTVIISGSPKGVLDIAAKKVNFEPYQIFSTVFNFSPDGKLEDIYPMLGDAKHSKKMQIVEGEKYLTMTDDLQTDYFITIGAEFSLIVGAKDPNIEQNTKELYVFDEKVREHFSSILNYIDRFEYSFVRSTLTSESEEKRIVEHVLQIKKSLKEQRKKDFLKELKLLNATLKSFNLFARDEHRIVEYEVALANESESEKRLFDEIISTLQKLPEYVNAEVFAKELGINDID